MKRSAISFDRKVYSLRRIFQVLAILPLFWIAFGAHAVAQQIKFTNLSTKDGMSSNSVNSIVKDKFGLIWIATLDGLNRYDGKDFKVYRLGGAPKTGFGAKEINVIREDNFGTLWVGTMGGGLYEYDRKLDTFRNFNNQRVKKLQSGYIISLYCDKHDILWVGAMGGLYKINTKNNDLVHVPTGGNQPGTITSRGFTCICADSSDHIWVGTFGGLFRSDASHSKFVAFRHHDEDKNGLPSDFVLTLATDKKGQLWVGTLNGLARLEPDGSHFTTYRYDYRNDHSLCNNIVNAISADSNAVWVATEGGLNVIDNKTGLITRYQHDPRNPYSLSSKSIHSVYIDPRGIYWVGTYESGISKYDKNLTLFNVVKDSNFDPQGLSWPVVSSFAERKDSDMYVGSYGGGLNLFHVKTGLFNHIQINSKQKITAGGLSILSMLMDRHQNLWIGTYQHGLFRYDTRSGSYEQFLVNGVKYDNNQNNIFSLGEDIQGRIWVGTNGAGVTIIDPATGKKQRMVPFPHSEDEIKLPVNGYIRDFRQDQDGCMWIASYGAGLTRYHPQSGKFDTYNPQTTGFPFDHILSMLIDEQNNVWVGTGGDGLFKIDLRTNKITAYTAKNGLSNGVIHKIIQGKNGNIWVSTNHGLCVLNTKTNSIVSYSQYNGLQSDTFYDSSGLLAADGTIYFGGVAGFNYFKESDIRKNNNVPTVMLNQLSINNAVVKPDPNHTINEAIEVAKEARIPYKESFAISFIALNYTLPHQNRYKYFMKGLDKNWVDAGGNTTAYYTNLDPGTYTFMVKACNNDGQWNKQPATIKIIIPPPFWMTGYAYFIYLALIAGCLWLIRRNGIKKIRIKMEADQERKAAEAMHELDLMKIKFLTNLSHEFRTPVSLIVAPADKLLAMQPDQESLSQLRVIKRNARRLLNLVNQLLDFKKIEEHELRLNCSEGEIVQFIRDITDSFRDLAEAKNIHFSMASNLEAVYCLFDHDKIERVLFNLLSNAFKFTPPSRQVIVTITGMYSEAENAYEIIISVKDNGVGMTKQELNRVFDRFYQAEAPLSVLNQGSGIGLAITKELVNLHGGDITVQSEKEQGSTFTVKLKFAASSEKHDQATTSANHSPFKQIKAHNLPQANNIPADWAHVLVIEDNDEFRNYLVDALGANYKMSSAIDGRDGWQKALALHPDLIVSDISMPYIDGIQLSNKLKSDKRTSHIPIILLTAHAQQEDQLIGLGSGASDYVTKPFNFDILNIKIKNLLNLNKKLKETYQKQVKVLTEEGTVESSVEKFIKDVAVYVDQNIHDPRFSIEDISHHFNMSRGSFYNKLIEYTGQPPVEFIRNLKLEKATVLLKKTDHTIADIAYQTGFPTPHYFSKSFKTKYGTLPSEYRQQFHENYVK
ncbi:hybrid sensor histidine kinase/response regulator transcription factor [Mucilaginibacter sp. PPCGB 2223]|uniref:hybrid sensor histidine kinase/response regulator transcription factor n=1 Tax=Mucilaginibacter sp. PPCGB 2223 TaxID=1886027 RepID=UPI001586455B|nr:hybrid sensor histidine kinase/response regulator transcription factor [Mucilaginibacter sp. PPCGB 2223]